MDQANPGQTSLEDYDIDGLDPHLSDQTSGIGSDLEISLGTDPLDLCSTETLDESIHLDSRVFSRNDSVESDSNSVTLTSSVASDHSYFSKKKSVTEELPDGWKRISVQRASGLRQIHPNILEAQSRRGLWTRLDNIEIDNSD
jgi:hypothetical protein